MIISHRHKFIFIKTIKTAGTSIEVFLSQYCGPEDILTPITPPVASHSPRNYGGFFNLVTELTASHMREPGYPSRLGVMRRFLTQRKYFNHMPAVSVRALLPQHIWDGYFKFSVERNPLEKALSFYNMQLYRNLVADKDDFFRQNRLPSDWERYGAPHSGPIMDRILRYENLNDELGEVFQDLGIPYSGSLETRAKGNYRAKRETYQMTFNDRQRAILEKRYAKECAHFGYSWDNGEL